MVKCLHTPPSPTPSLEVYLHKLVKPLKESTRTLVDKLMIPQKQKHTLVYTSCLTLTKQGSTMTIIINMSHLLLAPAAYGGNILHQDYRYIIDI